MTAYLNDENDFKDFIYRFLNTIHHSKISDILYSAEDEIKGYVGADKIVLYKKSEHDQRMLAEFRQGGQVSHIDVDISTDSMLGRVSLSGKVLLVNSASDFPNIQRDKQIESIVQSPIAATVVLPVIYQQRLLGLLQLICAREYSFSQIHVKRAKTLAHIIAHHLADDMAVADDAFELLLADELISEHELSLLHARALNENTSIAHLLISEKNIAITTVAEALERYYQVPFFAYDPSHRLPENALEHINRKFLEQERWVPVEAEEGCVTVIMEDPLNAATLLDVEHLFFGKNIKICVGIYEDFCRYLDAPNTPTPASLAKDIEEIVAASQTNNDAVTESDNGCQADNTIRLVDELIENAYMIGASDIHIEPLADNQGASVRVRVDGVCRTDTHIPASLLPRVIARIKVISGMNVTDRRMPQDGKCVVNGPNGAIEIRVAVIPSITGHEAVVLRILSSAQPLNLEQLNLSDRDLTHIRSIAERPHGLFLVVGPTGSGKTTTLHGLLHHINKPERVIWTIEDPVEITQPGLQQVQVNQQLGLNFAKGLRSFLRADPDVIMVGEMRDKETAHIAIQASLTGHLVFSTLHTNSAPETIIRIRDMGIDSSTFTDSLLGVLAQRLVRKLCEQCAEYTTPTPSEMEWLESHLAEGQKLANNSSSLKIKHAVGCEQCDQTGYNGRVAIHELLINSKDMKKLIVTDAHLESLIECAAREGMRTLLQDGVDKIMAGIIDIRQLRLTVGD